MNSAAILSQIDPPSFQLLLDRVVESLGHFGVEFQVVCAALSILLLDLFIPLKASKHLAWIAIAACVMPGMSLLGSHVESEDSRLFLGLLSQDSFSSFYKLLFLMGSIPVILLTYVSKGLEGRRMGEYYAILLSSVFGAMLLASSTHFLMIFLALELLSFSSYVLVGYRRRDRLGVEAALKYIIYGGVASAIMLFGMSLFYGITGSGDLGNLAKVVPAVFDPSADLYLGLAVFVSILLVFVGIAYKIATIPMHFWAPDAYQGAPTPVTAFLAVLSKAGGFALAIRFFQSLTDTVAALDPTGSDARIWGSVIGFPDGSPWLIVVMVISVATMTLGNLAALWQTNLKRLLAYSSIAHAGFMMMGLTLLHSEKIDGIEAITFYLLAYFAMNFGAFAIVILVENRRGSAELADFAGLARRSPYLAAAMIVFLFSLIGLPPTGGFTGKLQLFMGLLEMRRIEYYILAIAAALNTAVAAYYYLMIAREMYFSDKTDARALDAHPLGNLLVAAMVMMTFYLFFWAQGVLEVTRDLHLKV
jgi:NADH-quinone oxidoreductase subunit N